MAGASGKPLVTSYTQFRKGREDALASIIRVRKLPAPGIEFRHERLKLPGFGRAPLVRYIGNTLLDYRGPKGFYSGEKRFEGFDPGGTVVHQSPGVQAADGAVREIPLTAVEAEALVDEQPGIGRAGPVQRAKENDLAAVAVARPLVEDKSAQEKGG